jgi:glutathione S-transferase kappa 1
MTKITFAVDIVSPYCYMAFVVLQRYRRYWNITDLDLQPVFLGGIMQGALNKPPLTIPNKGKWMTSDQLLQREYYQYDYELPDPFPINSINSLRFLRQLKDVKPDALEPAVERLFVRTRT